MIHKPEHQVKMPDGTYRGHRTACGKAEYKDKCSSDIDKITCPRCLQFILSELEVRVIRVQSRLQEILD